MSWGKGEAQTAYWPHGYEMCSLCVYARYAVRFFLNAEFERAWRRNLRM